MKLHPFWKLTIVVGVGLLLGWFVLAENLRPLFFINDVNMARLYAENRQCEQALSLFEQIPQESHVAEYIRAEYLNTIRDCFPETREEQAKRARLALELLEKNIEMRPSFTRYWSSVLSYSAPALQNEENPETRDRLSKQGWEAFDMIEKLSPGRTKKLLEQKVRLAIEGKEYEKAIEIIESECPANRLSGRCDWYLAFANIGKGEFAKAQENIKDAAANWDDLLLSSEGRLNTLVSRYILFTESTSNKQKKREAYLRIRDLYEVAAFKYWPENPQYHASLALVYRELGEYDEARVRAEHVLQLAPGLAKDVELFLQSLPQR